MTPNIDQILDELKQGDGTFWEMALGELHMSYNEVPFWILVRDIADARPAAEAFSRIIRHHMDLSPQIQFTVSFNCISDRKKLFIDYLEGDEIFDENRLSKIGSIIDESELHDDDIFLTERKRRGLL